MAATNYAKSNPGRQRKPGTVDRNTYLQGAIANAPRGQELPQTKLLDLDVVDIRSAVRQRDKLRAYISDNLSNAALAKKYRVHVRTIEKVVQYETFSHLI